jgi:hypothetical protein
LPKLLSRTVVAKRVWQICFLSDWFNSYKHKLEVTDFCLIIEVVLGSDANNLLICSDFYCSLWLGVAISDVCDNAAFFIQKLKPFHIELTKVYFN